MKRLLTITLCILTVCMCAFSQVRKTAKSTDLTFFELKGAVKSMKMRSIRYVFDRQGRLLTINGKNKVRQSMRTIMNDRDYYYTRDKAGNLIEEYGWEYYTKFNWKDGRLASVEDNSEGCVYNITYTYDDNGLIISAEVTEWEESDESDKTTKTTNYIYKKFDSHGNWTLRMVGDEEESRTIVYY